MTLVCLKAVMLVRHFKFLLWWDRTREITHSPDTIIIITITVISYLAICCTDPSLVAQRVKRLPTMWETQVRSLGWEDSLEKEIATLSSTLAWKIPWMEKPGRLLFTGSQRVGHHWATSLHFTEKICRAKILIHVYIPFDDFHEL